MTLSEEDKDRLVGKFHWRLHRTIRRLIYPLVIDALDKIVSRPIEGVSERQLEQFLTVSAYDASHGLASGLVISGAASDDVVEAVAAKAVQELVELGREAAREDDAERLLNNAMDAAIDRLVQLMRQTGVVDRTVGNVFADMQNWLSEKGQASG